MGFVEIEGEALGLGVFDGEGIGVGVAEVEMLGVLFEVGLGSTTFTPLSHTNFFPLLIQVYLNPL